MNFRGEKSYIFAGKKKFQKRPTSSELSLSEQELLSDRCLRRVLWTIGEALSDRKSSGGDSGWKVIFRPFKIQANSPTCLSVCPFSLIKCCFHWRLSWLIILFEYISTLEIAILNGISKFYKFDGSDSETNTVWIFIKLSICQFLQF